MALNLDQRSEDVNRMEEANDLLAGTLHETKRDLDLLLRQSVPAEAARLGACRLASSLEDVTLDHGRLLHKASINLAEAREEVRSLQGQLTASNGENRRLEAASTRLREELALARKVRAQKEKHIVLLVKEKDRVAAKLVELQRQRMYLRRSSPASGKMGAAVGGNGAAPGTPLAGTPLAGTPLAGTPASPGLAGVAPTPGQQQLQQEQQSPPQFMTPRVKNALAAAEASNEQLKARVAELEGSNAELLTRFRAASTACAALRREQAATKERLEDMQRMGMPLLLHVATGGRQKPKPKQQQQQQHQQQHVTPDKMMQHKQQHHGKPAAAVSSSASSPPPRRPVAPAKVRGERGGRLDHTKSTITTTTTTTTTSATFRNSATKQARTPPPPHPGSRHPAARRLVLGTPTPDRHSVGGVTPTVIRHRSGEAIAAQAGNPWG